MPGNSSTLLGALQARHNSLTFSLGARRVVIVAGCVTCVVGAEIER